MHGSEGAAGRSRGSRDVEGEGNRPVSITSVSLLSLTTGMGKGLLFLFCLPAAYPLENGGHESNHEVCLFPWGANMKWRSPPLLPFSVEKAAH